jgi:hypothetical protein
MDTDFLSGSIAQIVLQEGSLEFAFTRISAAYQELRQHIVLKSERRELIRAIFLDHGDILFHPSCDYQPSDGQPSPPPSPNGYPHDIRALWSFEPFLNGERRVEESLYFSGDLTPTSRLVCSGGPRSNAFSRMFLPSCRVSAEGPPTAQYQTVVLPSHLEYLFGEDPISPPIYVQSMMHPETLQPKTRKLLWRKIHGELHPWQPPVYEKKRLLNQDFLLVTRLPRTHSGGDITIFSGGHGAGTQAVSLLLHSLPASELHTLADALAGKPYFQFVLEVSDLRHSKSGTIPGKVKLSETLPPVELSIRLHHLRHPSKP